MGAVLTSILSVLGPVLSYLAKKLVDRLLLNQREDAKIQEQKNKLERFKASAMHAVRQVDVEYVLPLKDQNKWNLETQEEAKRRALKNMEAEYGIAGITELCGFFNTNAEGVRNLMKSTIEAAIYDNRNPGTKAGSLKLDNNQAVTIDGVVK